MKIKLLTCCIWVITICMGLANIIVSVGVADSGVVLKENATRSTSLNNDIIKMQRQLTSKAALNNLVDAANKLGLSTTQNIAQITSDSDIAMSQ